MSQYVETPCKTFTAGAAIAKYLRVKLSAGKLAAAGVADDWIGTMENAALADLDKVAVRLRTAQGTCKFVAAGAITAGARVYAAASGKIDDTITTELVGIALEAANDADEVIEVMQLAGGGAVRSARGEIALDGSNPTPVATGLATITSAFATIKTDTALADLLAAVTVNFSGSDGTLNLYAWGHNGTDPTLAASTSTLTVEWMAFGT